MGAEAWWDSADRLAPADEANLVLDRPGQVNVFLAAGVLAAEGFVGPGGDLDLAALRDKVRSRMAILPEFHRIPRSHHRHHHWVDVEPDLEVLVRRVDDIATLSELEQRCADLMTVPLPSGRPLWELLLLPWPSATACAFILRVHHVIADGSAAVEIVERLMGGGPAEGPPEFGSSTPQFRAPSERATKRSPLARFGFGVHRVITTLSAHALADTALLGPRSDRRGVRFMEVELEALAATAHKQSATVNDALLVAVSAGYRALLEWSDEPLPGSLPVSVPVALRRHGSSRNQVGVMLVQLPLRLHGDEAFENIRNQTRREKPRARDQGTLELMRGPYGAKIMNRVARRQHLVAGFVTDVPGPRRSMELAGALVLRIWPVPVLAANVRLGIAAVSYQDRLYCTLHFDVEHLNGTVFANAMQRALSELSRRAEESQAGGSGHGA